MFDANDVKQTAALETLVRGKPASVRFSRRRLERDAVRHERRRVAFTEPTTRSDTTLIDLHGLPDLTIRVAELLITGASWGDVCGTLGISRRELDAQRVRLAAAL